VHTNGGEIERRMKKKRKRREEIEVWNERKKVMETF
jgi:hypothetical protein